MEDGEVPAAVQPRPEDYAYDLDRALQSVVGLRATIPRALPSTTTTWPCVVEPAYPTRPPLPVASVTNIEPSATSDS